MKWQRDHYDFTFELLDDAGRLACTVTPTSRRDPVTHAELFGWVVFDRAGQQAALAKDFEEARSKAEALVRSSTCATT